jgi:hypothetical protein
VSDRTEILIDDIKSERYGKPLVAALHLCLELEFALDEATRRRDAAENERDEAVMQLEKLTKRAGVLNKDYGDYPGP